MALCLTLNSLSFAKEYKNFEIERSKIIKLTTHEFKERFILNNSLLDNFLKNLFTDGHSFDGKTHRAYETVFLNFI